MEVDGDGGCKEEPDDFIETHCHWVNCDRDFNTQDDLVKVSRILFITMFIHESKNDESHQNCKYLTIKIGKPM